MESGTKRTRCIPHIEESVEEIWETSVKTLVPIKTLLLREDFSKFLLDLDYSFYVLESTLTKLWVMTS